MRRAATLAALCLFLLAAPVAARAAAAPGDLDRSFAEDGSVDILSTAALQGEAFEMAIGSNGTVFLLGRNSCGTCGGDLVVSRFRSDGSLIASYGDEGAATAFPGVVGIVGEPHIAIDSQDRAVVVAQQMGDVIVSRLTPTGALDPAFGGIHRLNTYSREAGTPLSLAIASDDRIVVGSSWVEPQAPPEMLHPTGLLFDRMMPDGTLDSSFGSAGSFLFWVPGPASFFDSFALARDGSMLAAGHTCCPGSLYPQPILVKIDGRGESVEPEYGKRIWGSDIRRRLGLPQSDSIVVKALFLRKNGRLDLILTAESEGGERLSDMLRVRPDGRLDRRFGDGGVLRLPMAVDAAAVDSEGSIVAVSRHDFGHGVAAKLYAFRLKPNGHLDRTFGGGRVFLRKVSLYHWKPVVAFAGRRPLVFERGDPYCSPEVCRHQPFLIRLRGGTSHATCLGHTATIVGTARGETLTGTKRADVIAALGGNDTVRGGGGNDLICGGPGRDRLIGGPGRDRFSAADHGEVERQ